MPKTPPNLLDALSVAPAKPSTAKKPSRASVAFEGFDGFAAMSMIYKEIEGQLKAHPVREAARAYFVTEGRRIKRRPGNIEASGDAASGSVQLKVKPSTTNLSLDTQNACTEMGIHYEPYVAVPKTLRVKPELFSNTELLNKLLAAVEKATGRPFNEVFEIQDEVVRQVPTDKTLDDMFAVSASANVDDDRLGEIYDSVAVTAITAKYQGTMTEAFEVVRQVFAPAPVNGKGKDNQTAPKSGKVDLMAQLKASLAAG